MSPEDFSIAPHASVPTSIVASSILRNDTTTFVQIATVAATTLLSQMIASTTRTALASDASAFATADSDEENTGECQLLGPFAILVQGALGLLALSSLVFKRWRERPQRPVKIWFFDASKQVFGSVLLHVANLAMSMFSSGELQGFANAAVNTVAIANEYQPNPCSFYLLNLAIDTTIGIPILVVLLKLLHVGASYTALARPPESIKSGHYGTPAHATWWLKQSMIYFVGLLSMKICVFFIFQLCPWIVRVGDWALRWTEGNEALQIAFVMLIFPLIMNAIQYYIIDTFIKGKQEDTDGHGEAEQGADHEHGGLLANEHNGHGQSVDEDEAYKATPDQDESKSSVRARTKEAAGLSPNTVSSGGSSSRSRSAEREAIEDPPRI